jgi:hypothetical protein
MKFANNYSQTVALPLNATSLALSLGDGLYRLTITNAARTAWEIVDASVEGGAATLVRAREGTTQADWPAGSTIYCPITAGQLAQLFDDIESLKLRVGALEGETGGGTDTTLVDGDGNHLVDDQGNQLIMGA